MDEEIERTQVNPLQPEPLILRKTAIMEISQKLVTWLTIFKNHHRSLLWKFS